MILKIIFRKMREEADTWKNPTQCENCDDVEATISTNGDFLGGGQTSCRTHLGFEFC